MLHFAVPDGHEWLRVADPGWADPIDPSYSVTTGGRWNPPGSWAALYLSHDLDTARRQILRMLEGTPFEPGDLADDAYDLVTVTLPDQQTALDVVATRAWQRSACRPSTPPPRPGIGSPIRTVGQSQRTLTTLVSTGCGAARQRPSTAPAANSPGGPATERRPGTRPADRTAIGASRDEPGRRYSRGYSRSRASHTR